ncbi:MAG: 30S ribosomal protein S5 [bacterium]|nr:30S ribosomal protein S5 [bacterium]
MARQQHRQEKQKGEFEQKTLEVSRVTRVVEGGKRFSFRAALVIGDLRGRVALGVAKGADVSLAIEKAAFRAKKDLFSVPLTKEGSISHEVRAKYGSAKVLLKPAAEGRGIVAGGAMRTVCALSGIRHVTGKILNSTNKINIARATIAALRQLRPSKEQTTKNK